MGLQKKLMEQSMVEHLSTIKILLDAIARRRMVDATYNGSHLTLAPHQLFVRHQSIYLSAFNPAKKRRHDEEPVIGHYNIVGLFNVVLTETGFSTLETFTGALPRETDRPIASILDG